MCKKLFYLISVLVLALCLMPSAQAANITLVAETQDYDADGILDDQGLVDWLVAEGHVVDVQRDYWTSFGRTTAAELNAADLIIVSRTTSSGNYDEEDEPTKWNSLTSPLILLNAYVVRNTRWLWFDSGTALGEGGAPPLEAVDPGHPIFTNVPLDASNQVQVLDGAVGSGNTSFIDAADVGNGTLIAQTVDGLPWIVEWDAGAEFYAGAGQVPGGKRMTFFAGTQETDEPLTPWGAFNLTTDGEILLRNAISYMLGEHIAVIEPPPPALVGHWKFDDGEGAVAVDSSGNGNDGIINGDPQWVEGVLDGALEFDGDGDWIDCGTDPSLNTNIVEAVTVSAWIKVAVQGLDHKVGGNQDGANGGYKMSVYNDKIEFEIRTSANSAVLNRSVEGGTILEADVWYHVAGVYSLADGYIRTYVDGVLDRELLTTEMLGASPGSCKIGCEPFSTGQYNFNGIMDDVRIYDGAMTEEQIQAVMMPTAEPVDPGSAGLLARWPCDEGEGAVVSDASGNGNDGTFVFGDPAWVEGHRGSAVELVGPTLIEVPPLDVELTEATMAGWILPYGPQPDWSSFIMTRTPGLATGFNVLGYQLAYHWNDTSDSWSFRGGDMIAEDDWTFAAVTIEPDKATFYVNGKAGSVNEITHGPCLWNSNIYLGGDGNDNWIARRMIGALDDVVLYDRALSEAEIRYLAGERATPVDPGIDGLAAYYPLDIDALDASGNGNDGTLNGDPQWVDGKVGGALEMDGGDFVDVPGAADINPESITLATWVYFNEVDPAVMERQDYISRGDDYGFSLHEWNANQMIHGIVTSAGGWSVVPGSTVVEPQTWYHTAMTYDVDTQMLILYLDGEVDGELSLPAGLEHRLGGSLTIGTYSGRDLLGRIDEIVIYNRALSAGEIRYLAGHRPMVDPGTDGLAAAYVFEADAADSSGNGLDGTLLGDAHVQGGLLVLDGEDDAVAIPGIGDGLTEFTFSMMVYPTVDVVPLQFSGGINTDSWGGGVHLKLNYGAVNVGVNGLAGGDVVGMSLAQPNMWTHLALTVSPDEVAVYFNGEKEGSRVGEVVPAVNVGAAAIGAWNNGGTDVQREMTGMMDNVLIYNRALSEAEVRYLASVKTDPVNLLQNPSFEEDEAVLDDPDWANWCTWNPTEGAGSNATIVDTEAADGARSLRIEPKGVENWHFIVLYLSFPADLDKNYTTTFWAKAEAVRPLTVQMKAADNSINAWGATDFELTTEWAEYSYTSEVLIDDVKLEVCCSGTEVPFWLDLVSVCEAD